MSSAVAVAAMQCPLCGSMLGASERMPTGRYSCPICAPTAEEARQGWLPIRTPIAVVAAIGVRPGMRLAMQANPWLAARPNGDPVSRIAKCECGQSFTQTQLSERFMLMVERQGRRALDLVTRQIPDYFVPVHCPKCERIDLGHATRLADLQRRDALDTRHEAAD